MADIVDRLRSYATDDEIMCDDVLIHEAANEIERLYVLLATEKRLADQLAVALAAQGSASFDEDTNSNIKRLALDAFKEARRG